MLKKALRQPVLQVKELYYVSSTALLIFDISVLDTGSHREICLMFMLLHFCTQAEQPAPEELETQRKTINILDSKSDVNVDLSLPAKDFRSKRLETLCQSLQPWHKPQPNEVTHALFIKMCPIGGTRKKSHYRNPERINCYCRSSLPSPSPFHAKSTPTRGANSSSHLNYTGKRRGWVDKPHRRPINSYHR